MRVLKRGAAPSPDDDRARQTLALTRPSRPLDRPRRRAEAIGAVLGRRRAAAVAWRAGLPDVTSPIARTWSRLPRWSRWGVGLGVIVLAVLAPADSVGQIMAPASDWKTLLFYPIGIYVLLAVGLNIVVGQAGMLDLGYVAFFAIGAYTMALLGATMAWTSGSSFRSGWLFAASPG